jgi:hypothetical protein
LPRGTLYGSNSPPAGKKESKTAACPRCLHEEVLVRRFFRDNSLSIVTFGLFLLFWAGQCATGFLVYNDDREEHGKPQVTFTGYLTTGHFLEATAENWESEYLQMGLFVLLTVSLRQRGAAESRKTDEEPEDESEKKMDRSSGQYDRGPDVPGPVRWRGLKLWLYERSLSTALLALFVACFVCHVIGGRIEYNEEQAAHGKPAASIVQFLASSDFWFQSLQNWQSEFLAIGSLTVLSIFLRQKGSPESKPVDSPHDETGGD